jgi:hypothetical protein
MAQAAGLGEELPSKAKQSRSEKKARKAMSRLGEPLDLALDLFLLRL